MTVKAIELAKSWKRPYSSVEWAWVNALGLEPSTVWGPGEARAKRPGGVYDGLADCFENRRAVVL